MTVASQLMSTLYEAVWSFEAAEQLRHGVRPATEIIVDTGECRVKIGIVFDPETPGSTVESIVDVSDDWIPKAIKAAVASFVEWRDLHDRLEATKAMSVAHKRGVKQAKVSP